MQPKMKTLTGSAWSSAIAANAVARASAADADVEWAEASAQGGKPMAENKDMDQALRKQVIELLEGGSAHLKFDQAVAGLSPKLRAAKPASAPHSAWQLIEHLRIAQWDILEFSRNPKHVSPEWPKGYWPDTEAPPSAKAWESSIKSFKADLAAMEKLVSDRNTDLFAPIPRGDGQTVLREALLVADHNAYHLGQLVLLRRLLGAWKDD
jgi:hypothetical protein